MGLVYNALGNLGNIDFFTVLLPFVLFLAISYGLLQKVGLFGKEEGQKINAVISIAIAFFAVNYTTYGADIAGYLTRLFGSGSLVLSTILLFIVALQFFGIKLQDMFIPDKFKGKESSVIVQWGIVFVVLGIGAWAFFANGYGSGFGTLSLPFLGGFYLSNDLMTTLVVLGILGLAVWLILKSDSAGNTTGTSPAPTPAHPPTG